VTDHPVPALPITDAERAAAIDHLRHLVATDRLSLERFDEAAGAVVASATHTDLAVALDDLPTTVRYTPPERRLTGALVLRSSSSPIRMVGRWQLAETTVVRASSGSILLDLTQVEFDAPVIDLEVRLSSGSATIVVPVGVTMQIVGGGGIRNYLGDDIPLPGAPVVRLRTKVKSGSVRLRRPVPPRPPRRRWWWWRRALA
jgi:hypothetical protein